MHNPDQFQWTNGSSFAETVRNWKIAAYILQHYSHSLRIAPTAPTLLMKDCSGSLFFQDCFRTSTHLQSSPSNSKTGVGTMQEWKWTGFFVRLRVQNLEPKHLGFSWGWSWRVFCPSLASTFSSLKTCWSLQDLLFSFGLQSKNTIFWWFYIITPYHRQNGTISKSNGTIQTKLSPFSLPPFVLFPFIPFNLPPYFLPICILSPFIPSNCLQSSCLPSFCFPSSCLLFFATGPKWPLEFCHIFKCIVPTLTLKNIKYLL